MYNPARNTSFIARAVDYFLRSWEPARMHLHIKHHRARERTRSVRREISLTFRIIICRISSCYDSRLSIKRVVRAVLNVYSRVAASADQYPDDDGVIFSRYKCNRYF